MNVHPVSASIMFTVRANSPLRVGPQWATVTGIEKTRARPRASPAGFADLDGTAKANGPALVVDLPRSWSVDRAGARYRSMACCAHGHAARL